MENWRREFNIAFEKHMRVGTKALWKLRERDLVLVGHCSRLLFEPHDQMIVDSSKIYSRFCPKLVPKLDPRKG